MAKKDKKKSRRDLLRKGNFNKSHEYSRKTKDDSGGGMTTIFEKGNSFRMWRPKEGLHKVRIVPYPCGDRDPRFEEGEATWFFDAYVHRFIGPGNQHFVCPIKTFANTPEDRVKAMGLELPLRCPICEEHNRIRDKAGDDYESVKKQLGAIKAKRRVIYNIICKDNMAEENKGIQLWDESHFYSEQHLAGIATDPEGNRVLFYDPEEGRTVFFEKQGKGNNQQYGSYQFSKNADPVDEEDLENAIIIDEFIHYPTYDEMKEAYFAGVNEEKDSGYDPDEDTDEGYSEDDEEEEAPRKRRTLGKKAKKEAEPEEEEDDTDTEDDEEEPEEDSEEEDLEEEEDDSEEDPEDDEDEDYDDEDYDDEDDD